MKDELSQLKCDCHHLQVINLVVARQNWFKPAFGKENRVWYLPTSFSVIASDYNEI
jgi:hypothetical protein